MTEIIFSKEIVNRGRQREMDLLKAYCVIMMIITHCIDDLFPDYHSHISAVIIDDIHAQTVGAHCFMIAMGVGIVFSRKASPKENVNRGIGLFITGQLLNLARYGIPFFALSLLTGNEWARGFAFLTFSSDILQFAGLFFLCNAVFIRLKLKPVQIFLLALVCNLLGMLAGDGISTGNYALDQFFGFFVFSKAESYFPLFHWMIFPGFGMLLGDILQHVKNKNLFYGVLIFPCLLVRAAYYYIGLCIDQPFFRVFQEWQTYCHPNIFDTTAQLFSNMYVICFFYFVTRILPDRLMKCADFVSKNINRFYFIHLIPISLMICYFECTKKPYFTTMAGCYAFAALLIAFTSLIVISNGKNRDRLSARMSPKGHKAMVVLVILASALICIWSAQGTEVFPNLHNDYRIEERNNKAF